MLRLYRRLLIPTGLGIVLCLGGISLLYSGTAGTTSFSDSIRLPITIAHQGSAPSLERPSVAFDHDRHTAALKLSKVEDCTICHIVKETDPRLANPVVDVFKFPKGVFDETDKTAIMYAYHNGCVGCHRKMVSEGKKTGPDIGKCGKCHVEKPQVKAITWAWSPLFNYLRHSNHVEAVKTWNQADKLNVAGNVEVIGEITENHCEVCHHTYGETKKKLIYTKDSENSCRACHKEKDEKNARSMKKVAHSACVGCHMKLAEKAKKAALAQGRLELTDQEKKTFGPFECKGCHGQHKELTPKEIAKIPRLVRGQKDVMDLSPMPTSETSMDAMHGVSANGAASSGMKSVPYNHKAHEQRGQFCNTCHHHSLEKCSNCHTRVGDLQKGAGVTYERAFHKPTAEQSCVGCHNKAKQNTKCQGCHTVKDAEASKSSCQVCHRGPSNGKPIDVPPASPDVEKDRGPESISIKTLAKQFESVDFPHQPHVAALAKISNDSSLARVFHAGVGGREICSGCHHKTDLGAVQANKVRSCSTCHGAPFEPGELGKPGLLAAYHRQCIGCHEAMKQEPSGLECLNCHQKAERGKAAEVRPKPGKDH
jgi:hypothetical protein